MKYYLTKINGKQFIYSDSDEKLISQKFAYHTTENKVVELDNMFYSWQSPVLNKLTHSNDSSYSLRKFVVVDEELEKLANDYAVSMNGDSDNFDIENNREISRSDFIAGYTTAKENCYSKEQLLSFRDWCLNNQMPYVRNGYQNLSTEQLFEVWKKESLNSQPTELEFLKEENGIDYFKKVKVS